MLRCPWQKLEFATTREDVALGFAGEHGGVVLDPETGVALALDGETFGDGGAVGGAQAAREPPSTASWPQARISNFRRARSRRRCGIRAASR